MKVLFFFLISISSFSFTIKIQDIKDKESPIFIAIYNKEQGFPYKNHLKGFKVSPSEASKGVVTNLLANEYAIVIFQDRNNNGKLDKSFFGSPKEPIGVSNGSYPLRRTPKFKNSKVFIEENEIINIPLWN